MKLLIRQISNYWLALMVTLMTIIFSYFSFFWQIDLLIYDWQAKKFSYEVDDRIIIVSIDEKSLERFGQWPWDRSIMATVIDNISEQNPSVIGLDVMYSEKGNNEEDVVLAESIKENPNIILPVLYEQYDHKGQLVEVLPNEIFISNDAQFGHVSKSLDKDGIVRRAFLKSGLGGAHWYSMSWQLYNSEIKAKKQIPGMRNRNEIDAMFSWVMDYMVYIPFAGPPSTIPYLSISDVYDKKMAGEQLKNKIVLIGATASGLGDVLITPHTAERNPMPGVEVIANEVNGLLTGTMIVPVKTVYQIIINFTIVFMMMMLYPLFTPRSALFLNLLAISTVYIISIAVLRKANIWMPPAIMIIMIQVGYILWSWQRLRSIVRLINNELEILTKEPHQIKQSIDELEIGVNFLKAMMPNTSGKIIGQKNNTLYQWKNKNEKIIDNNPEHKYHEIIKNGESTYKIEIDGITCTQSELKKMTHQIFNQSIKDKSSYKFIGDDIIGEKIDKVRKAYEEIRLFRRFTNHILTELQTGFIATDSKNKILMANPQAQKMIGQRKDIMHQSLLDVLSGLRVNDQKKWPTILMDLIIDENDVQVEAKNKYGNDILIFISLYNQSDNNYGYLVSILDISNIKDSQRQRREIMSFMTHDLRSPLVSILSTCELSKLMPEKYLNKELIENIESNARRTLQYAEDILYINHAENIADGSKTVINIVDIVVDSVEQVQTIAEAKSINIKTNIVNREIHLFGHTMMLGRAIVNLIVNAIKYSPINSIIEIDVVKKEQAVNIKIKDQGYGILEKDLENIFKRFVRVKRKEHENEVGSGLGLAFVRTVIEKHHGSIDVKSTINVGTEFIITIPLDDESE